MMVDIGIIHVAVFLFGMVIGVCIGMVVLFVR